MKRLLVLLLSAAITLTAFTGCVKGTQNSGDVNSADSEDVYVEPEPIYDPEFLTGLPKGDDYDNDSRVVAVMINNISACRPQRGISDAEVLVESKVEGGITRFMALFHDYTKVGGDIGPVRSGRDQFLQLAMPLNALYLHIGRSGVTQTYIDTYDYNDSDLDGQYKIFTEYDQKRINRGYSREHTAFTDPEKMTETFEKYEYETKFTYSSPWLDFVNYNDYENGIRELAGESAKEISVTHSNSYRTYFDYNEETGLYEMSRLGRNGVQATIDENNGKQLAFENVFVLFSDITTYPYPGGNLDKNGNDKGNPNYQKVDYMTGCVGYYFSNGRVEKIRWSKGEAVSILKLTDWDENSLKVNCGKTYIGIVDLDEFYNFAYAGDEEQLPDEEIVVNSGEEVETGEDVTDYDMGVNVKG